jgi:hypothetical protein
MEAVLPTLSLLIEVIIVVFSVSGRKRVELGLLDARCQRVGAVDVLHVAMVAPAPLATGMGQPTLTNTDDQL